MATVEIAATWQRQAEVDTAKRWQSAAHSYGASRVHFVSPDEEGKTLCGKKLAQIGGAFVQASREMTCKRCAEIFSNRVERERDRQEYAALAAAEQSEKDAERAAWFERYNAYLKTSEWRAKANRVLERAHGLCEGCGIARATQVHHLTYAHVTEEFLWELRAICRDCHERIHEEGEARR